MTTLRTRRILAIALAMGTFLIAPVLAAKGGKGQVINWQMTPTAADADARGKVQYRAKTGKERFNLTVHDLALGTYSFDLNGTSVATFDVAADDDGSGTHGKLRLKAKKGSLLFDPRGGELAVSQAGTVFLTASFPSSPLEALEIEVELVSTGALPDAEGEAELESRGGRSSFEVEIEHVPEGSYDVLVGGVLKGSITVNSLGKGEIEFDTHVEDDDDDGIPEDDLLLDFDPRGQIIQVSQNGTVILEVLFPTAATGDDDDDQGDDDQD